MANYQGGIPGPGPTDPTGPTVARSKKVNRVSKCMKARCFGIKTFTLADRCTFWCVLDGTGRDWMGVEGTGWDWKGLDGTGRDWMGLEGTGWEWMGMDGMIDDIKL